MIASIRYAVLGFAVVSLGACSASLDKAESLPAPPELFASVLHAGYVRLARAELDENDFDDADAFGRRATAAALGQPPQPEKLEDRRIPEEARAALTAARTRLVAALDGGARENDAGNAAEAQLAFECWMQEQEENFQQDDIAACRDRFATLIEGIERRRLAAAPGKSMPSKAFTPPVTAASFAGATEPAELKTRFVVYFRLDDAALAQDAEKEIGAAVAAAKRSGAAMIRIAGHADRAGAAPYNMALSRRRAQTVAVALRRLGLPEIAVATQAYGEKRPAVATPDGALESRNRRVEIELTH